jgi:hypothetical protein
MDPGSSLGKDQQGGWCVKGKIVEQVPERRGYTVTDLGQFSNETQWTCLQEMDVSDGRAKEDVRGSAIAGSPHHGANRLVRDSADARIPQRGPHSMCGVNGTVRDTAVAEGPRCGADGTVSGSVVARVKFEGLGQGKYGPVRVPPVSIEERRERWKGGGLQRVDCGKVGQDGGQGSCKDAEVAHGVPLSKSVMLDADIVTTSDSGSIDGVYLMCQVYGKRCAALVDTGANKNFVRQNILGHCQGVVVKKGGPV